MPKKLTTQEFIQRSLFIHNNKYDYAKSNYTDSRSKITIICPVHGEFKQTAKMHLKGQGCKKCALAISSKIAQNSRRSTTEEFIKKARLVHEDKFDYSLVDYKNNKDKVIIICPQHGKFSQPPGAHLRSGCEKCVYDSLKLNTQQFIEESNKTHEGKYIYSATTYSGCYEKVIVTCPVHGDFHQKAYSHKQGRGCSICRDSNGEKEIRKFLQKHKIDFISQKKFKDCKNIFPLPFDFYLPEYNMCIEFDGIQHFKKTGYDKDGTAFERTQKNDKIKNIYCYKNNIQLLRISYQDKIENVLNKILK